MPPRVFVVANDPEGERIAGWLRELPAEIRVGDGSDDTLLAIESEPVDVVVLTAGLATGDALAFANAMWEGGSEAQLVLIADDDGPVRTAIEAMEFQADRFLRRPLSRSALEFAVKSCLNMATFGRPGVATAVSPRRSADSPRPLSVAFAALGQIAPAPAPASASAEVSSGVALHTLASRIEQATAEAVDAFLDEAVASVLEMSMPADEPTDELLVGDPPERESTLVLSRAAGPVPAAAPVFEEGRTGTFVSALRRHMSQLEVRLFGEPAAADGQESREDDAPEIDLDAIGVTTLNDLPEDAPSRASLNGPEASSTPGPLAAPGTGRTPAPSIAGSLSEEDVASLLGRLARERFTGRVALRHGKLPEVEKTILIEDGRPVFAGSSAPADRMGDQLVREAKITREQLARAREILVASGRRMGEILVELGFLKRRELLPSVRRHVEDILYSLFAWETGTFSIAAGSGARDEKIRLATPPAALIVEGIRRKHGVERLRALVGSPATTMVPARRDDAGEILAEAELTAEERQAIDLHDGRRTIAEVAAVGPGELVAYSTAHALQALALATRLVREATDPGRVVTGASTSGTPAGSLTGVADAAIDRERVLAKHAHVREADYFELLGVRRDATAFEIRRAFEAARRDYAPESFPAEVQRELAGELAEIAEVLVEAQRVLRDDRVRAAYVENLLDLRE